MLWVACYAWHAMGASERQAEVQAVWWMLCMIVYVGLLLSRMSILVYRIGFVCALFYICCSRFTSAPTCQVDAGKRRK
jgi:FtsH-binding integral membrane protein